MRFKAAYRQRMKMLALQEPKHLNGPSEADFLRLERNRKRRMDLKRAKLNARPDTEALAAYFRSYA